MNYLYEVWPALRNDSVLLKTFRHVELTVHRYITDNSVIIYKTQRVSNGNYEHLHGLHLYFLLELTEEDLVYIKLMGIDTAGCFRLRDDFVVLLENGGVKYSVTEIKKGCLRV